LTYKLGGNTLGALTYGYDGNGRRTALGGTWARTGLPSALSSATYDDANQIATWASTSFTYDDNGNLTSDGTNSYTWNARNQLASMSGGASASFAYDGVGRRRSRTVGSTTTAFRYDGLNPVQELVGGSASADILAGLGIDEYFTRTDGNGARHFLTDALQSTVALADGSGDVETEYSYEPFGATTTSGSSTANPFGFTGRENDGTGLQFSRARYYDPRLQRFISEDPLGFGGGDVNLHAYVWNSTPNFTDPTGEAAAAVVLPLAGCLGGGAGAALGNWLAGRKFSWWNVADGCWAGASFGMGGGAGAGAAAAAARGGAGTGVRTTAQAIAETIRAGARDLVEQLAMEEAIAGAGDRIMEDRVKDPRYPPHEWSKKQHVHRSPNGRNTTIHYWENLITGARHGFKFK
jgi:RHS repeat-associated protein